MKNQNESGTNYCIIVNQSELYNRAVELGYHDIILLDKLLKTADIGSMKASGKCFALICFNESGNDEAHRLLSELKNADIQCCAWLGFDIWDADLEDVSSLEDAVKQFPPKEMTEYVLISRGYILDTDYSGRCGNCSEKMDEGDKYCRLCGTKRGEGAFKPFDNSSYVLYGAPIIQTEYECSSCGNRWSSVWMSERYKSRYCPECGSAEIVSRRYRDALSDSNEWFVGELT